MAESIAQNYFEKFTGTDAAAVLSSLPGTHPKTFEDNWLDFKSGKTRPDDLAGIWSKALGAMANAGGGVVVWGIEAKKHGIPPVDAAESLSLVPDVNTFASKLIEIARFATDPPLVGLQVKAIPTEGSAEGFVVCLIPEGKAKPYQSLKAKKPFYLRMGDESKEPPLSILRQLFYPKRAIRVAIELEPIRLGIRMPIIKSPDGYPLQSTSFRLSVHNIGEFTIEHGSLRVECPAATVLWKWVYESGGVGGMEKFETITPLGLAMNPYTSKTVNLIASFDEPYKIISPPFSFAIYGKDLFPLKAEVQYNEELVKVECL